MTEFTGFDDNMGFVLFSPDATSTNIYKEGIKQIQKNNLQFVAFRWIRTDNDIIDNLYGNDKHTKNHNHLLVQSLFNQGYSLACIVLATSKFESFPVVQFLKNFKGSSDPSKRKNTDLRKIFGAENKVINFIHTSDTPLDALNESKLFFADFVRKSLKTRHHPPAAPKYEYRKSVSVYHTIHSIKFSIYEKFRKTKIADLENLLKDEKILSAIRNKDGDHVKDLERISQCQLDVVSDGIFDKKIQGLFELLIKIQYTPQHIKKILEKCKALDVDIDKWDEIILKSQAIQGNPKNFL